jgi:hypothetical protein
MRQETGSATTAAGYAPPQAPAATAALAVSTARNGARQACVASPALAAVHHHPHGHRRFTAAIALVIGGVLLLEGLWLRPHFRGAGHALAHPLVGYLALAVLAEVSSLVAMARIKQDLLGAGGVRVSLRRAIGVTFAANAMSVTLPGGAVVSMTYSFKRMRSWGASASLVTFGLAAGAALSSISLAIIAVVASTLSGHTVNPVTAIFEIVIFVAAALALRHLLSRPDRLLRLGSATLRVANRLRGRPASAGTEQLAHLLDELLLVKPRGRDWLHALLWATWSWVADLLCLIAACRAVGADGPAIAGAAVAYSVGMAASSISLLPAGLGVVDGTLILALSRDQLSTATATAGVLVYRLITAVLITALGWAIWFALRTSTRRRKGQPRLQTDMD